MTAVAVAGTGSVVVLASGGLATVGPIGGLLGALAGLVGTYIALRTSARTARNEYAKEIADAKKAGADAKALELQPVIDNLRETARRDEVTRQEQQRRDDTARTEALRKADEETAFWRDRALGKKGDT